MRQPTVGERVRAWLRLARFGGAAPRAPAAMSSTTDSQMTLSESEATDGA